MSTKNTPDYPGQVNQILADGIPGVEALAQTITEAQHQGVLFFLAVEVSLLVKQYFDRNGLPPTPVDLEAILAEAAQAMAGE